MSLSVPMFNFFVVMYVGLGLFSRCRESG